MDTDGLLHVYSLHEIQGVYQLHDANSSILYYILQSIHNVKLNYITQLSLYLHTASSAGLVSHLLEHVHAVSILIY